ncbi:MAG: protein translocase subunit SecF [Deltaproteobacteria bacterium]|nr:protein translocase subunit SecF [Deltaproteobacteria bacterium]
MSEHKFRYMLTPGSQFRFVSKFKSWIVLSIVLTAATIGILFINKSVRGEYMNWTIDFAGGTEIMFKFHDASGKPVTVDVGKVRDAYAAAGEHGLDIGEIRYTDKVNGVEETINGISVKTPRFSALEEPKQQSSAAAFREAFAKYDISKASWNGDRLRVRAKKFIPFDEGKAVLEKLGFEVRPWDSKEEKSFATADEATKDFNQVFTVRGLDRQYEKTLDEALAPVDAVVIQSSGVGARAGDKLRDDAAKSLIYAIALIMLYLAFRFDIRYAPGAAFAVIHDAVMVIGVYALTWTEVSLTTVAALLTVMGYSVNETVISFDRIRENESKLKGKSIERIIDISINERLTRTIMTASTVFATTLIMNIFGTGLVKNFAFAMNVGVIVATYSSIFLAAPIFLWISKKWYSGPPRRSHGGPAAAARAAATTPSSDEE